MHQLKRFAVTIAGAALVVLGILLMPLPGPGFVVVAAGLAVLATEYVWARRLLKKTREKAEQAQQAAVSNPVSTTLTLAFAVGMIALGTAMIVGVDIPLGSLAAGIGLVLGGIILVTTTILSILHARGHDTTHCPGRGVGAYAASSVR